MADLKARFQIVDEMSDKLSSLAESGKSMFGQWVQAGEEAGAAFDGVASIVTGTATTIDGVATSIENARAELGEIGSEWERELDAANRAKAGIDEVSASTDILAASMEQANETISELALNENISAEAKEELEKAAAAAAEAMQELNSAQAEATAAMENYDAVIASGTTDLSEFVATAERACHAADNLAEANEKARNATEGLSKSADTAAEEADKAGEKGTNAVEGIAGALAAAGITAMVKEIAETAYELVDAFSEAESTVVKATGASGEALDGLTASMMNAYAASKSGSLDDTAGAIGEINTRMALTGDELTDVTGKFLDFSDITGTDVVGSVQNVTKIMNKWNVEGSEVESVLDKLAYAGQISGVSVDTLSNTLITGAASFQEMGLSLDNAISMLAQFELYGMTGTTAITAMRTAVKNFSDDGLNAETALQSVINEIANMETAADATALAVDTFGSRAGVDMANAIRSGALSVDTLTGSLEVAQGTVKNTAQTAQTLEQKWTQATGNVSAAFTTALQPSLDNVSSGIAGVVNAFGSFLNEHPAVTKAITATGIGLGVVVTGIAGVTFVTTVAVPAVEAFGTALNTALGPIGWAALAITGIVAAGTAFIAMMSDSNDETAGMTATTREQYYELQGLNAEYEKTCEEFGATSEEASRLKYKVDELSAAFEEDRKTVEELSSEVEELCNSASKITEDFHSEMESIENSELGALSLIQRYKDLATQTELTRAQQEEFEAVTKKLSESYPELVSKVYKATSSAEDYADALEKVCKQEAEEQKRQQAQESFSEVLLKREELLEKISEVQEDLNLEQKKSEEMGFWEHFFTDTDIVAYQEQLNDLNAQLEAQENLLVDIRQNWEEDANAIENAISLNDDYEAAAATAYESVRGEIEELCTAYDEAYKSAIESFGGQFGLFDEASTKSEEYLNATVENAQKAINSQLEYWESYSADVETLKSTSAADLGITQENYEALMSYAQDGSGQAAGLAHSIASAIKQGDEEAVAALANTVGEVESKQAEIAAATADWQTNFTAEMNKYQQDMEEAIKNMDMSEEAKASATSTVNGYADAILEGKDGAVAAAQKVANEVAAALQSAKTSVNVNVNSSGTSSTTSNSSTGTAKSVEMEMDANGTTNSANLFIAGEAGPELIVSKAAAYAAGTTNSDDFYIAGEEGPELIVGKQGSTVFPTEETDRIINSLSDRDRSPINITAETGGDTGNSSSEKGTGEQVKRILLEIAGSGAVEVGGGASKESILEVLTDHIKPVLLSLLQQEIYEEGDLSYDF